MIADGFEIDDDLLWGLVNKYLKQTGNSREDLFNEARVAALIAFRTYDKNRKTKLSTWVFECVKNRLENLRASAARREDGDYDELCEDHVQFDNEKDLHFYLTMQSLLTPTEFAVFKLKYVDDFNDLEIREKLRISKRRVKLCSTRILLKYKSLVTSLDQSLSQRMLQDRWLEDSPY